MVDLRRYPAPAPGIARGAEAGFLRFASRLRQGSALLPSPASVAGPAAGARLEALLSHRDARSCRDLRLAQEPQRFRGGEVRAPDAALPPGCRGGEPRRPPGVRGLCRGVGRLARRPEARLVGLGADLAAG